MSADKSIAMQHLCDITSCSICLKTLTDPRMLPCTHTFCFRCLEKIARKAHRNRPGFKMPCPLCRKEFAIPDKGLQELQKNFLMKNVVEVTLTFNHGQPSSSDSAGSNSSSTRPTTRGIGCRGESDLYNSSYLEASRSPKRSTDDEAMVSGNEEGLEAAATTSSLTNCEIHRDKQLDVYCADCRKVVCVSCLYDSHRLHDWKDVGTFEAEFRQIVDRNVAKIKRFVAELSRKKNKLETREEFLHRIDLVEEGIRAKNRRLKALIDRHTSILLESLASIKSDHLKTMQTEEEELDFRSTALKTFGRHCNQLRSKGSVAVADLCRIKEDLLRSTDELEKEHETFVLGPDHYFEISFKPFNIIDILKTNNSNIIGEVKGELVERSNYLIVTGVGQSDGTTTTDNVGLLRLSLDHPHEISSLQEIPIQVTAGSAASVHDNTVFVAGIGDGYREIWKYSLSTAWKKCGSMLQGRLWHCTEFIGEQLFIMGGCSRLPEVKMARRSIEAYSLVKKRCEAVGKLKYGVKAAACVAHNNSVFVFGGLTEDGRDLDCVQVYNTLTKSVTLLSARMPRPSRLLGAVVCGSHAILMGQHTCFLFNIDDETWEERNHFKTDVSYFGLILHNERIFVVGGCSTISDNNNWIYSNELKYVSVLSLFKDEFASWKIATRLPKPTLVHACGMVTGAKCA